MSVWVPGVSLVQHPSCWATGTDGSFPSSFLGEGGRGAFQAKTASLPALPGGLHWPQSTYCSVARILVSNHHYSVA